MFDTSLKVEDHVFSNYVHALVCYVRSGQPDLTNRQLALLLTCYTVEGPHTVRGLAGRLNISKPIVTRALDTLCLFDFVRRERDMIDRRNVFIVHTETGKAFVRAIRDAIYVDEEACLV